MADTKYGRVFTEQDVRMIVQAAIESDCESDQELTKVIETLDNGQELKFPPDEPIFILRGQDQCAPAAIDDYREWCVEAGAQQAHLDAVLKAEQHFEAFQTNNPDRVKVAD